MDKFFQIYFCFLICLLFHISSSLVAVLAASSERFVRGNEKSIETPKFGGYADTIDNNVFNVKDFGATGDGSTDDSKAFQATFQKACQVKDGVMLIPTGFIFLLQSVDFVGNACQQNITIQVDGTIVAPSKLSDWIKVDRQWFLFTGFIKGLTIKGKGVIDGRGDDWWSNGQHLIGIQDGTGDPRAPHAVFIQNSINVTVTGITIKNSPHMHIFFLLCQQIEIFNFTLSSPKASPNTDGIHLSNSQHVDIHNSTLGCGDDCISIQSGSSNVKIYDVYCGPGHGYSIGGLGFNKTRAQVSDVGVYNSTVENSLTGVRIKTWQGGLGYVQKVTFSNITMINVQTAIAIDQNYCNGNKNCTSTDNNAVAISNITYENITGTFTTKSVTIVCSRFNPCKNITMGNIDLTPSIQRAGQQPVCSNAFGRVTTTTTPPLDDCVISDGNAPLPLPQ